MAKFCPHCGMTIKPNGKFCPSCGQKIQAENGAAPAAADKAAVEGKQERAIHRRNMTILAVLVLGIGFFAGYRLLTPAAPEPVAAPASAKAAEPPAEPVPPPAAPKSTLEQMQDLLAAKGVPGRIMATSYRGDQGNALSLAAKDGWKFVIYNAVDDQVAYVDYDSKLYHLSRGSGYHSNSVCFVLELRNADPEQDKKAGVWSGTTHRIPILALYEVQDGAVVPGRLTTAQGALHNIHYHGFLYDQRTVNTTNILLTDMAALEKSVYENHVSLP